MIRDPEPTAGHSHDQPADRAERGVGTGRTGWRRRRAAAGRLGRVGLGDDAGRGQEQGHAEGDLDRLLHLCVAPAVGQQHAQERGGHAAEAEPATRAQLTVPRRACTKPPNGFITALATRSLDTAASGGPRRPAPGGRHQRAAAHAGQADDDPTPKPASINTRSIGSSLSLACPPCRQIR